MEHAEQQSAARAIITSLNGAETNRRPDEASRGHNHGAADDTTLVAWLRRHGLKLTPQRHLICQLIENSDGHPTAEELYEAATEVMPSMSLKTVYTTLNDLAALNAIRLVNVGTGGFRVERNMEPHGHLVCRSCGYVVDIPVHPALDEQLTIPPGFGFHVEQREVTFRGLCKTCASAPGEGANQ